MENVVGMNYIDFGNRMDTIGAKFLSTEYEYNADGLSFIDNYDLGDGRGLCVIVEKSDEGGVFITSAECFDMEDYGW